MRHRPVNRSAKVELARKKAKQTEAMIGRTLALVSALVILVVILVARSKPKDAPRPPASTAGAGVPSGLPTTGSSNSSTGVTGLPLTGTGSSSASAGVVGAEPVRQLSDLDSATAAEVRSLFEKADKIWRELYPGAATAHRLAEPRYESPQLILFSRKVEGACGLALPATGCFYCIREKRLYIDASFLRDIETRNPDVASFARAYVIGHIMAHHIMHLLGISDQVENSRLTVGPADLDRLVTRLELEADYLAGVFARHLDDRFNLIEEEDFDTGLTIVTVLGADLLGKRSAGLEVIESFTHGSSDKRKHWFEKGFKSGNANAYDTFSIPFEEL